MKNEKFDLLFLCHEKDINLLKKGLEYAKKNIVGYRKIFVLSKENYFPKDKEVTFISEKIYPFNKEDIGKYAPKGRAGWYYQQFLKLYFLKVTKERDVLDNVLISDADLLWIKKTTFFEKDIPLYNVEIGYHQPYYDIMKKVFGFGKQIANLSGTVHHMIYQRKYIKELLRLKPKIGKEKEFWKNIMKNIDLTTESGFSEQDMYFNFMLNRHPNNIKIRKLRLIDFPRRSTFWIKLLGFLGYDYIANHEYLKEKKFSTINSLIKAFFTRIGIKKRLKEILIDLRILKRK